MLKMIELRYYKHAQLIALAWLLIDCLLAYSWQWIYIMPDEKDFARNHQAMMLPFLAVANLIMAGLWARYYKWLIPFMIMAVITGVASVLTVDFDTWIMPDYRNPVTLRPWLNGVVAWAFLFAWWCTSDRLQGARFILGFGACFSLFGIFELVYCPPTQYLDWVCGGVLGEDFALIMQSILASALMMGLWFIFRSDKV